MIPTLGLVLTGCAERMSIIRKHAVDLKTTALFKRPCDADVPMAEYETMLNRCNRTRLSRMIEQFETIQEMEPAHGIPGDTIEEVRAKGFSIYEDANPKLRRPNTLVLYGNDALAAVGMGVSAPPLRTLTNTSQTPTAFSTRPSRRPTASRSRSPSDSSRSASASSASSRTRSVRCRPRSSRSASACASCRQRPLRGGWLRSVRT